MVLRDLKFANSSKTINTTVILSSLECYVNVINGYHTQISLILTVKFNWNNRTVNLSVKNKALKNMEHVHETIITVNIKISSENVIFLNYQLNIYSL